MKEKELNRLVIMRMKCLRSTCDVIRLNAMSNNEVTPRVYVKQKISNSMDRNVLKWFRHIENMSEE